MTTPRLMICVGVSNKMIFETYVLFILVVSIAQYSTSCSSNEIRLRNVHNIASEGLVQVCDSGSWRTVCDQSWDCTEGNIVCRQLGYIGATAVVHDAHHNFGYYYYTSFYYSCNGSESYLTSCAKHNHYCGSHNEAGVRCANGSFATCNNSGDVRLIGGKTASEGVLQYCYDGEWSVFCNLDDEEAAVACKQMGYTKYFGLLSTSDYIWDSSANTISLFNSLSCSSTASESSLAQCTLSAADTSSTTCAATSCQYPTAIKCYNAGGCTDGEVRLTNGSIAQEGRVEVCVDGVWSGVCWNGWNKQAAFVLCKQFGYYSEPVIYSGSKYGNGMIPIVYYNIQCNGWENSITECSKTNYLNFACSSTAGVLCPDGCNDGDVRLIGGGVSSEGTVEVCADGVWGLITDAGWDENDAKVVCRQLNLPYDGAYPLLNSYFGKPDRIIHYSYVLCNGNEENIASCGKLSHSFIEGRKIYDEAVVAGVGCEHATPTTTPPCLPLPEDTEDECVDGKLRLEDSSGLMEYCIEGQWSSVCHLTHNETTVACRQLGYTTFTWGLPYDIESTVSSTPDTSLISNISCTSNEQILNKCVINKQTDCLKYCESLLGLHCYGTYDQQINRVQCNLVQFNPYIVPGDCIEGSVRLVDGIIEQEGRVEVCANGVWGSICDNGWDKTDAHIVCRQLGFSSLEPMAFKGVQFGPSSGPLVYSDVDCGGWEKGIEECVKRTHLEIQCSHKSVAGVLCSDDCSDGEVRLVGSGHYGTVELCYGHLWGLVNEEGWNLPDANVICHQLGFSKANNATVGSVFGRPNRAVHIGNVKCDGTETAIDQCVITQYSLEEGKRMTADNTVGVAGVICYTAPLPTSSIIISISSVSTVTTPPLVPSSSSVSTLSTSPSSVSSIASAIVPPPLSSKTTDGNNAMMIALLLLVCVIILMMCICIGTVFFCYCKLQRRQKIKSKSTKQAPFVAFSREVQNNMYDSVSVSSEELDEDTVRLVTNIEQNTSEKVLEKTDITFKSSDDEADPVYEECSTNKLSSAD